MPVYIIRFGTMLCGSLPSDYQMDTIYYPNRQAAKAHLYVFGFKWDGESHLYLNHASSQWAAIDRFSEAKNEKVMAPVSRPIADKWR